MEKEIIQKLAIELAKRDMASLECFICGMRFADAYKILNGYNLDTWIDNGVERSSFDVNFKSISTTIFRNKNGYCSLNIACDVWLSEYPSPIGCDILYNS